MFLFLVGVGGGGGNFKIYKKNFEFNFNDIVCVNDIKLIYINWLKCFIELFNFCFF